MKCLTVPLRGVGNYRQSFHKAKPGTAAEVSRRLEGTGTAYEVVIDGEVIGLLSRRKELFDALERGWSICGTRISWANASDTDKASPGIGVTVFYAREALSDEDLKIIAQYEASPPVLTARSYMVGVVGEASYQQAIRMCHSGERVTLYAEMNNPYDDEAVVVKSMRNQTIGYLGREHWLRNALLHEGKGCSAMIAELPVVSGIRAVVLEVTLDQSRLRSCAYMSPVR
jgi:hypothetical protein